MNKKYLTELNRLDKLKQSKINPPTILFVIENDGTVNFFQLLLEKFNFFSAIFLKIYFNEGNSLHSTLN